MKLTLSSIFLATVCVGLTLAGCGGSGGGGNTVTTSGSSPAVGTATPRIAVDWPVRTRDLASPATALSVNVHLQSLTDQTISTDITGDRNSNLALHNETYSAPGAVKQGTYALTATFYAGAGETGTVVATASANVTVNSIGALVGSDGVTMSQIGYTGVVASVQIPANQSVVVGANGQLTASAFDASGGLLAVTQGSFLYGLSSGSDVVSVSQDGVLTGLQAGTAVVTASIDGIKSPAATVSVTGG